MNAGQKFLNALRQVSKGHEVAAGITVFMEERMTPAEVTRALPPAYPKLSEEQFRERVELTKGRFERMGLAAPTYEEFISSLDDANAHRGMIPVVSLHQDDDQGEDTIALIPVADDMLEFCLSGENLAGYSNFLTDDLGSTTSQPTVLFANVLCTDVWLGLAGIQAAFVAKQNILSGETSSEKADLAESVGEMMGKTGRGLSRKRTGFTIDGFRLMAQLLDKALGGVLFPSIESFGIRDASAVQACVNFLTSIVGESIGPPISELEGKARAHLLMHAILTTVAPQDALLEIYGRPEARASMAPHLMMS